MTTANENAPQLSSEYVVGVFETRRDPQIEILSLGRPQHIRGWEAADTHRLNREAWRKADGAPLNEDLDQDLETVRNRAAYEAKNNGMVEGVIWSCQRGVVGANGPILRVLSESEEYNRAAERIWRQWAKQPTPRPGVSLASVLRLWVRRLWDCGEFFAQKITGPGPISLRLKGIHPRRVASPFDQAGREDVVLGVRVDRNVVPQQYFVADQRLLLGGAPTRYEPVPADLMIHGFLLEEEDQLRGVPWFASCLGAINDVRSFDNEVLEAARNAAKASIFLYTQSTDAGFFPMSGTTTLRSGTINTAPPGYQVAQLTPTQPGAQYHQYRPERHREIGRVRGMSLMEIRQDASGHNYSSARFDGQSDALSYRVIQAWLAGEHLDPLVDEVLREAELARLTPRRPDDVVYQWIWPGRPHVDPTKERTADRMALEDGTMSYTQLLADHGHDPDRVIEQRRLDNERLVAAGLAPIRTIWETGGGNTAERAAASDLEETVQDAVEEIRALGEQLTTRDDPQRDLCTRTLNVRAATINEDERSVEAVVATEQRSVVYDWNRGTIEEVLIAGGAEYGAQVPLLDNHYRYSLEAVLGSVRQIRVSGDQVSGRLYFARGHEAAETAWNLVRQGHLTDVSVGYRPIDGGYVDIEPGQTAVVAGRSYTAGSRVLRITQRWVVKEVSIVPIGADSAAKIREDRATLSRQEQPMLRQYLISLGMRADASDAEMQAFITTLQGSQRAEADRLAAAGHATPPAQPQPEGQRSEPPATPPVAQPSNPPAAPPAQRSEGTPPAQESPAELARRAIADERLRVRSIRELARDDVPQELVNRAIDEGWDDNRASREFLTAVRERRAPPVAGQAPAGHVRDHATDCNVRSLAAGLLISCGGDPTRHRFVGRSGSQPFTAQDAELGHRYSRLSAPDLIRECARIDSGRSMLDVDEAIDYYRTATSGGTAQYVFTSSINARLTEGYQGTADTTRGWCNEEDVPNFLQQEDISLDASAALEKLGRGDVAKHATVSDTQETYRLARYAKQFVVDEQDIIDDRLGAIMNMPFQMGEAAARLRPDLVYALMLENPAMADTVAVFNSAHGGNLITDGLDADGLKAAITAMGKQTNAAGEVINLRPRYLLVPSDLEWTARALTSSAALAVLFSPNGAAEQPTRNLLAEENLTVVSEARLGTTGVTDPRTKVARVGTATNWFLTAGGPRGLRVAYRRGTGRRPQMRSFMLTQGRWGMGWDINHDIGVAFIDYRGWLKSSGTT